MNDIDNIRRSVSLPDIALQNGVALQKSGDEWEGLCPFHDEKTPSFTIYPGRDGVHRFMCFGCQAQGDVIDFVEKLKGVETREAISIIGGGRSGPNVSPAKIQARDPYAGIELLKPRHGIKPGSAVRLYNPKRAGDPDRAWGTAKPSMVFPYYRGPGDPLGYVLRNDMHGGGKETPMVCWVRLPDGTECWSRFTFPRPRPVYIGGGRDRLSDGQVIVVEGEKCADAMARATGRQAVSWCGGTFGVLHTDWSPLAGRSVVIWPDADKEGIATGQRVARALAEIGCAVKILDVPIEVLA